MTKIYTLPESQRRAELFRMTADGVDVPVRECFVSAMPYNRRWPGCQRSTCQRETAYFAGLASDGCVKIELECGRSFKNVVVRPLSKAIAPSCDGNKISFTLSEPGGYTVELDGYHGAMHIFLDPPEDYNVDPQDENVLYFGSGEHYAGKIELKSGQTLYIDSGAVLYATVRAENAENIRILGRGILDNSENIETILFRVDELGDGSVDIGNSSRENTIHTINCSNVTIDGITIRDSLVYNVSAHGCNNMTVNNIKTIGCWRYNSDGVDLHNCTNCVVSSCFIRTFDDSICVKGHDGYQDICDNITVRDCVVWCDWDHALEIGAETRAAEMKNIVFRNCDVIRSFGVALDIYNIDYGHVHDVLYEDIRVEFDDIAPKPQIQPDDETPYVENTDSSYISALAVVCVSRHHEYSSKTDERRGRNSNIYFKDISVFSTRMPRSWVGGYSEENNCSNITFDGIYFNGTRLADMDEARIRIKEFTENVKFI